MSKQELTAKVSTTKMGQRLDSVVAELFPEYSRNRIQDWIKTGNLTLNGKVANKASFKVFGGENVVLQAELENEVFHQAENLALNIVYEDNDILVIDKPVGLVVHPGAGNPDGTLLNALLFHYPDIKEVPRAGIVHRLDKDTSGLMVVAKTVPAQTHLVDQLQRHEVGRIYDAVVVGKMISGGQVDKPIGRHPRDRKKMAVLAVGGKRAVSKYRVLERFREHSLVRVELETGRTHQIRVHMAAINFPLVGDPVYGSRFRIPKKMDQDSINFLRTFKRQALHAGRLTLIHPSTGKEMSWRTPMPDDMFTLLDVLREDMESVFDNERYEELGELDDGVEWAWVTDADIPKD